MIDIVIDTCTLKNASDSKSKYFEYSIEFIDKMLKNEIKCIVDEGFSLIEIENKSYIGLEYLKHLQPGTLGFKLVTHLASTDRMNFVSKDIPNNDKNFIEQKIRNKKDRMFLRVTYNSKTKILASHDFTDYQINKRKLLRKKLSISIVTAKEINPKL
jgi:predicted nucleic acid-binding protein